MVSAAYELTWQGGGIRLDRCRVMGVLNVTPDSFSDGGRFSDVGAAVERAWQIAEEGADVLDIGGESTRPGTPSVGEEEERSRVFPVLERLSGAGYRVPVSLDTRKPRLADEALEAGLARIINDVGGLRDPEMARVVRRRGAPVVVMHMFGSPETMQEEYRYGDVVADICAFFRQRLDETGFRGNVLLDPGIGFGKSVEHNLTIIRRLDEFRCLGHPVLVGASRKSFIGRILNAGEEDRLEGSLAAAVLAAHHGAAMVRVHDVAPTVRALRVARAIRDPHAA